jgi:hypothetical protein
MKGLVFYMSRINGVVKIRTAQWNPQLTDEEIAADLAEWGG